MGEKLARGLLDSDCESCSGRRRTSHVTAAERATDYVRKVRAAIAAKKAATAAAAAVILTEDEEDGEEVWIEEDEDSDPGHVPLGKKGPDDPPDGAGGLEGRVGTAFSLSGSGTDSVPSLRNPLMEVVLDHCPTRCTRSCWRRAGPRSWSLCRRPRRLQQQVANPWRTMG